MTPPLNLQIGELRLDPANECLWRGEQSIALRPKAYSLLRYLVEHPGRIVTKDELLDEVWAGTIVGDAVLKVCVRELRQALGDTAKESRFIETVHRRGYRFKLTETGGEGAGAARVEQRAVPAAEPKARAAKISPAATAAAATAAAPRELLGREHELAELSGALEAAHAGERRLVFVSGEPGIGKSALIDALTNPLDGGDDVWVLRGQCLDQFGAGEAYLPVLDALSRCARGVHRAALREVLLRCAPTWLVQLPSLLEPGDRDAAQRELFGATQGRMLREMAEALEVLTESRSVVLCLEDLHWADPSTVDLLAALARRTVPARLLVVGSLRPSDLIAAGHPLHRVLRELSARALCSQLHVGDLSEDEVAGLVRARLGGRPLPPELAPWVHRSTGGNPLFAVNLTDSLTERGVLQQSADCWTLTEELDREAVPSNVLALLDEILERREPEERRALEAASIAGVEFTAASLADLLDVGLEEVEDRLERLVESCHFLDGEGPSAAAHDLCGPVYRFTHALYPATLRRRLSPGRARRYHLRYGEHRARLFGDRVGEIAAELALEFERAGSPERAVHYLVAAAEECVHRFANREACAHLEHALALCAQLSGDALSAVRIDTLDRLGLAQRSSGSMQAAADTFRTMAEAAQRESRGRDAVRALLLEGSAASWLDSERCQAAIRAAAELGEHSDDPDLRVHVAGASAYWTLLWSERREADAEACAAALAGAAACGELGAEGGHAVRLAWFHWLGGRVTEAAECARHGSEVCERTGEAFDYLLGQYYLSWALLHSGDWGELGRVLASSLELAERNGHASWSVLFRLLEAWLHHEARDFAVARDLANAAGAAAAGLGHDYPQLLADTIQGLAYLGTGEEQLALPLLQRSRTEEGRAVLMGWSLALIAGTGIARVLLHRGELDEAERVAREVVEVAERSGERTSASLGRRTLAEVAAARGDSKPAAEQIQLALAHLDGEPTPLAGWRVHLTAAELLDDDTARQAAHRATAARIVADLADSLGPNDPLRATLHGDRDLVGLDGG